MVHSQDRRIPLCAHLSRVVRVVGVSLYAHNNPIDNLNSDATGVLAHITHRGHPRACLFSYGRIYRLSGSQLTSQPLLRADCMIESVQRLLVCHNGFQKKRACPACLVGRWGTDSLNIETERFIRQTESSRLGVPRLTHVGLQECPQRCRG